MGAKQAATAKKPVKETAQTPIMLDEPKEAKPTDFKVVSTHMTILGPRRRTAAPLTPMQLISIASTPEKSSTKEQ